MDDHEVGVVLELARVQLLVAKEDLAVFGREALRRALERVVDRLGDVEKLVAAVDHAPLGLDADVVQQRDQGVLDLGDAAAEGGGREMDDPLALERLGQSANLVHEAARRDRRVVAQSLVTDVYELEHLR